MTRTKIEEKRRRTRELIRQGFRNALKCSHSPAEERPHRTYKGMIAEFCWNEGLAFQTEVTFNNGERADVVIEDWGVAIEVLSSETRSRFDRKEYPLPVIPFRTKHSPAELMNTLIELRDTEGSCHDYYAERWL